MKNKNDEIKFIYYLDFKMLINTWILLVLAYNLPRKENSTRSLEQGGKKNPKVITTGNWNLLEIVYYN